MNNTASKYYKAALTTAMRYGWPALALFITHEICGHVIHAYARWPAIDMPLHFFGGVSIAVLVSGAVTVLTERQLIRKPEILIHITLVFALTCTAALFWEFAEWTADHTISSNCQLGRDDTMLDLFLGAVGGGIYSLFLIFGSSE